MVTLKELQIKLAKERKKAGVEERIAMERKKIRKAQADIILAKHRKAISVGKKARAISGRFGRALLKTGTRAGRKIGPAIVKQARLIREQQLRDDARERILSRKSTKKTKKRKSKRKTPKKSKSKKRKKSSKSQTIQIVLKR